MSEEENPFDQFEIEGNAELTHEQRQDMLDFNSRIHRVFEQNPEGKKLLELWTDQYVMNPTVIPGQPLEAHGINEGKASLVRGIIKTIKLVEANYNQGE